MPSGDPLPSGDDDIPARLRGDDITIYVGEQVGINAGVEPDTVDATLDFNPERTEYFTIVDGVVTGTKASDGKVPVTITANVGGIELTKDITITVLDRNVEIIIPEE